MHALGMLFDQLGRRKYLTRLELGRFARAADSADPYTQTFCLVLAYTGARLSEVRSLTSRSIELDDEVIVIECLKRRRRGIFRSIPIPPELVAALNNVHDIRARQVAGDFDTRLWPWS